LREEEMVVESIAAETGLAKDEAELYLKLLRGGALPAGERRGARLLAKGMAIISGDGKRIIPVHPRLGVANQYRTWREQVVREINERRMRVDKLILELIPVYEAAMEKMGTPKREK
jgi:hypothetical protein